MSRHQRRVDKKHARRDEVIKKRHTDPTKGTTINRPSPYERLAQSTRDRINWLKTQPQEKVLTEKSKLPGFARRFLDKLITKEKTDGSTDTGGDKSGSEEIREPSGD